MTKNLKPIKRGDTTEITIKQESFGLGEDFSETFDNFLKVIFLVGLLLTNLKLWGF